MYIVSMKQHNETHDI